MAAETVVQTSPTLTVHVLVERDEDLYSALCLELDVASQGATVEEAKANLREAIELCLEEVRAAGEEAQFIPRPAPVECWLKYFEAEARQIASSAKSPEVTIEMQEVVYG